MRSNLIFIGMPAVGKSTIGVVVAKRLGMHFIDTDLLIQEQEGRLLREIIADVGEDGFLKIENQVNRDVNVKNAVISPGGSVVYCHEAMQHFKEIGTVVYLKASYQTIKRRIRSPRKRGVVLREGQTFKDLYHERTKLFEQYADITVCEDGYRIEQTIENVLNAVESLGK
ncbi:shikimate kinase [Clostridium sp. AF19-22AC]|jgi:shikimate kinase|uniref:Shikimate kinase n=1 Tax=Faecalicatena orotica TaxID=1544 RepID=A0A2Y9BHU7_9FIRM|nr:MULTISPECIES: shikimate kinase [Clostridia]PWJ27654.1 shikimate kinase [Faecalicatena orotica]RHR24119.1 shikimate kinase [Clostridium sp. AF19-22AC]SSA57184.1 shikimate kinase [Faecalicatena orotica]